MSAPLVTAAQVRTARAVMRWYLRRRRHTPQDLGSADMYCDPARLGRFASPAAALRAGDPSALFKALIATTLFQRRQDLQVLRILQQMPAEAVLELTDLPGLLSQADHCACPCLRSNAALIDSCDLTKDPATGKGVCSFAPGIPCGPKRHTVWLKRYGHFGKVPTSAALALREAGARDLGILAAQVADRHRSRAARGAALQASLQATWRVNEKISAMFLSAMSSKTLGRRRGPWTSLLAGEEFVVIDSNVDAFLAAIGYSGPGTYAARRAFITALARRLDLRSLSPRLPKRSPRLLQQAMYAFMSKVTRGADPADCALRPGACARCPTPLRGICPVSDAAARWSAPSKLGGRGRAPSR